MKRLALAAIIILASSAVWAQLKVDVALVNVVATVTDDRGLYVPNLTAEDFILQEDGQSQTISHLSQATDLPVSMGITLDTSGSMERKISTATTAVERFIRTIHEDDDIFLLTFSDRPVLRQDFTSDRSRLASALARVTVGGGTALYDALDDSLRKTKQGAHDKKAILLITDGVDTSSFVSFAPYRSQTSPPDPGGECGAKAASCS
jgi:Ca-activated chloride channel homolog